MKAKRSIAKFFFFISILMLVVPVMPHHHHSNGLICMKNDLPAPCSHADDKACSNPTDSDCSTQATHHPCCCNTYCVTSHFTQKAPSLTDVNLQPDYTWVATLFYEPAFRLLLQLEEKERHTYPYYLESLHSTLVATATGLRAPPTL